MDEIIDGLYISNITLARTESKDHFDTVITVCQDDIESNVSCNYEWYNMSDGKAEYGGDDSYKLFKEAADSLKQSLENNETTLIHCHAGQSRSVTVSIAAISVFKDIHYDESYKIVKNNRGTIHPNARLLGHARDYISESETGETTHPPIDTD